MNDNDGHAGRWFQGTPSITIHQNDNGRILSRVCRITYPACVTGVRKKVDGITCIRQDYWRKKGYGGVAGV